MSEVRVAKHEIYLEGQDLPATSGVLVAPGHGRAGEATGTLPTSLWRRFTVSARTRGFAPPPPRVPALVAVSSSAASRGLLLAPGGG